MKRWLFNLVAAVSLPLSLASAAGWALSYARPLDWHLLGIAHSADLTRVDPDRHTTRANFDELFADQPLARILVEALPVGLNAALDELAALGQDAVAGGLVEVDSNIFPRTAHTRGYLNRSVAKFIVQRKNLN